MLMSLAETGVRAWLGWGAYRGTLIHAPTSVYFVVFARGWVDWATAAALVAVAVPWRDALRSYIIWWVARRTLPGTDDGAHLYLRTAASLAQAMHADSMVAVLVVATTTRGDNTIALLVVALIVMAAHT